MNTKQTENNISAAKYRLPGSVRSIPAIERAACWMTNPSSPRVYSPKRRIVRNPACANMSVTIMNATPLVLSARNPMTAETTSALAIPARNAGAGVAPNRCIGRPSPYIPAAKNNACPRLRSPVYPNRTL